MYRIAILGCENSHANQFLNKIKSDEYKDKIQVVGVYSDERQASQKLSDEFGVEVAESYDAFVGKIDALVITARHGDNHYKYAKPYLDSNIPMFIDKPITCTESEAKQFRGELEKRGVRVCGGSACIFAEHIRDLASAVKEARYGKTFGGYFRAPIVLDSPFGGFFFYAQHLVQIVSTVFGYYPDSVTAEQVGEAVNCTLRYGDSIDVNLCYTHNMWSYYAGINCEGGFFGDIFECAGTFDLEFEEFYSLLLGGEQRQSYEEFFAPVYTINALYRALQSGKREKVNKA